jgi:hypothetical protein
MHTVHFFREWPHKETEPVFKLEMSTNNAAFAGEAEAISAATAGPEIGRILRELATKIERDAEASTEDDDTLSGIIADLNGNTVGSWTLAI